MQNTHTNTHTHIHTHTTLTLTLTHTHTHTHTHTQTLTTHTRLLGILLRDHFTCTFATLKWHVRVNLKILCLAIPSTFP